YTWNNVRPGTFLYHSGTHPAVQVQMGLYGAIKKDAATGQAYSSASTTYTKEGILVLSEVDPVLHAAVASGSYGPGLAVTSTMSYSPKYFLYNGVANLATSGIGASVVVGDRVLIRLLNAGLRTRMPLLLGLYMTLLAQDGNLLPYPLSQYSLNLEALKTMDVMISPTAAGSLAFHDRRGFVSLGSVQGGGTTIAPAPPGPVPGPGGQPGADGGGGCFISSLL
ncbi:MAG: hypothetical protein JRD68_11015, partial [Deltaproteobacteria bacterium]|nr:hypothetical protein [Deltaproteobacteria bacterium]